MPEGRPFYKTLPVRLGVTLITVILLTLAALAIVFTGSLAGRLGGVIGVGSSAVQIWDIAKWPVMIVFITIILAILYYAGPNVRQPGFRWVTPGGLFAVSGWIVASALFALYVANFFVLCGPPHRGQTMRTSRLCRFAGRGRVGGGRPVDGNHRAARPARGELRDQ